MRKNYIFVDDLTGATLLTVSSKKYGTFLVHIDEADKTLVASYQWHVRVTPKGTVFGTNVRKSDGNKTGLYLHRLLKVCPDGLQVDHIHHEGLDLRQSELRCVTGQQNVQNQRKQLTSKGSPAKNHFKGVHWHKVDKVWQVNIGHEGKRIYLGRFPGTPEGEIEAAKAYDKVALGLYTHPLLNFPTGCIHNP